MRRENVRSSNIHSIGYDGFTLEVAYRDNQDPENGPITVYQYEGHAGTRGQRQPFPQAEYDQLMRAASKGTYMNTVVKPANYLYRLIGTWPQQPTGPEPIAEVPQTLPQFATDALRAISTIDAATETDTILFGSVPAAPGEPVVDGPQSPPTPWVADYLDRTGGHPRHNPFDHPERYRTGPQQPAELGPGSGKTAAALETALRIALNNAEMQVYFLRSALGIEQ